MLLLNNEVVAQILDMKGCMEALETGYKDLVQERANYRGRYDFFVPNDDPKLMYRWGTMEGASRTFETMAIRMKSDMLEWPDGKTVEKYCVQPGTFCGIVMVFSTRNGEPLAIINDGYIQHMRVGGCAGLGVKYLSREDAGVVGIFGSGGMARTYLLAFNEVRRIREVRVYSPTKRNRENFAAEMSQKLGLKIVPVENPQDAVPSPALRPTNGIPKSSGTPIWSSRWAVQPSTLTTVRCASAVKPPSSPVTPRRSNALPIPKSTFFLATSRFSPISFLEKSKAGPTATRSPSSPTAAPRVYSLPPPPATSCARRNGAASVRKFRPAGFCRISGTKPFALGETRAKMRTHRRVI
jgi:alanine dehydrogenase